MPSENQDSGDQSGRAEAKTSIYKDPKIVIGLSTVCICLLALAIYIGLRILNHRPTEADIKSELSHKLNDPLLEVIALDCKFSKTQDRSLLISYKATIQANETFYEEIDKGAFLDKVFSAEKTSLSKLHTLLASKYKEQLLKLANLSEVKDPLVNLSIVKETTVKGQHVVINGEIEAKYLQNGWELSFKPISDSPIFTPGKVKAFFGSNVVVLGNRDDLAALGDGVKRALIDLNALSKAQAYLYQERRTSALTIAEKCLAPGSFFAGSAKSDIGNVMPVFIEIIDINPAKRKISALIYNDGGWDDARPFYGGYGYNDESEEVSVFLGSESQDALEGSGPIVGIPTRISLLMKLSDSKLLTSSPDGGLSYSFESISQDTVRSLKDVYFQNEHILLSATQSGIVYKGTATSKSDGTKFGYLLWFENSNPDGKQMSAVLTPISSIERKRSFQGTIILNKYKNNDRPIRLATADGSNSAGLGGTSPLGIEAGYEISLKLTDGGQLKGESSGFTFEFERAPSELVEQLKATQAQIELKQEQQRKAAEVPTATGAYVWLNDQWVALPHNNAHIERGLAQSLNNVSSFLSALSGEAAPAAPDIWGTLVFDGYQSVPEVDRNFIKIVVVGQIITANIPREVIEANPQLANYPSCEMEAVEQRSGERRVATLYNICPGLCGFKEHRIAANVQPIGDSQQMITFDIPPAAGDYALACGSVGSTYEIKIK